MLATNAVQVDIFGVDLSITDYEDATKRIVEAGRQKQSFAMSALATHGLMEAVHDPSFREVVNNFDGIFLPRLAAFIEDIESITHLPRLAA